MLAMSPALQHLSTSGSITEALGHTTKHWPGAHRTLENPDTHSPPDSPSATASETNHVTRDHQQHHHHHHQHHTTLSRDNCDRRRPDEEESSRLPSKMPTELYTKTVTPFLREHIPGIYAPIGKPEKQASEAIKGDKDPNSKFCYRHRPDSKCRRAADETKMVKIQRELDRLPGADQQAITHVWSLFSAAPARHRDLILQGIITQCCFPQLSTVSREVHEQLKIDFIAALPTEISFKVLGYLDTVSLCKAAQVSRRWRDLADDDVVWHHMCEQHIDRKCTKCGWGLPLLERQKLRDWRRQQDLLEKRRREAERNAIVETVAPTGGSKKRELVVQEESRKRACVEEKSSGDATKADVTENKARVVGRFKQYLRDRFKVGSNWKYGRCAMKTFKGHDNGVTCLQFDDNILVTGSYDAKIKVWDINTGKELRTLKGHTMGIRALKFVDNKLFSGSLDNTVKVWNWQTGECISTLRGHTQGVISVDCDSVWLASGSIDKNIKVFNFDSKETFCLRGHDDWVNHVRLEPVSQVLFSASDDCTIKIWDLEHKNCIKTLEGHMGQVQQILLMPEEFEPDEDLPAADGADANSVASARSSTPSAYVHNASTLGSSFQDPVIPCDDEDRAAYGPAFANYPSRPLPPRYILTAGLDNTIKLWCTASGKCVRTMFGHVEGIWGLAGDSLRLVTGANDSMVKVWEPRSGKCERTFTGHTGPVTCVGLSDSRMASGSEDGEVRLYSFEADGPLLEEYGTPA